MLWQIRETLPRHSHGFEDTEEHQEKQSNAGKTEVHGILKIDIVDLQPLLSAYLIQCQPVHSDTGAENGMAHHKTGGSNIVAPSDLRGAGRIGVDTRHCRHTLYVICRQQRKRDEYA